MSPILQNQEDIWKKNECLLTTLEKEYPEFMKALLDEFGDEITGLKSDAPPFTDATWLSHLELIFSLKSYKLDSYRCIRRAVAFGPAVSDPMATSFARQQATQAFTQLLHAVEDSSARRLAKATHPDAHPMVLRLTRRYRLVASEADLFQLLFMRGATKSPAVKATLAGSGKSDERELAADVCGLSSLEVEEFLDEKRPHMADGVIVEAMDDYEGGKMMHMASEAVSVLLLRPLTTQQRLKLSRTELLSVMDSRLITMVPQVDGNPSTTQGSQVPSPPGRDTQMGSTTAQLPAPPVVGEETATRMAGPVLDEGKEGSKELEEVEVEEAEHDSTARLRQQLDRERQQGGRPKKRKKTGNAELPSAAQLQAAESLVEEVTHVGSTAGTNAVAGVEPSPSPAGADDLGAYKTSLEYLDDAFQVLALLVRTAKARHKEDMKDVADDKTWYNPYRSANKVSNIRELRAKLRFAKSKLHERLRITESQEKEGQAQLPRLEALARKLGLDEFEKSVVVMLTGVALSPVVKGIFEAETDGSFPRSGDAIQVKDILTVHFDSFKDQVLARPYFYKSGRLAARGIIKLRAVPYSRGLGDLTDQQVELDRRMLDWIVGLDTQMSELVEGSHLYTPKISIQQVVLPEDQKSLLLATVDNFGKLRRYRQAAALEEALPYGSGLVILLCGASGTGKTMTVNALAHHLGKKVLLVDFQSLYTASAGVRSDEHAADLRGLFRDAEMNDAVIFFDECEAIFAQRERGGDRVLNALLTEMERYEGIIMLATNRPLDLDEAMHRRITHVSEFRAPDHKQREQIWKVASEKLPVAPAMDWSAVALRYELTGGYIKNALVGALLQALSRDSVNPIITQDDIISGCRLQMRGSLQMKAFAQRVVPRGGLDQLVLPKAMRERLDAIVGFEKARAMLLGQWGFPQERVGAACLFWGPHGTGKSAAAEALGFELGRPLKVVNCAQLVSQESTSKTGVNISAVFKDAALMQALLVLEDFQLLGGDRDSDMLTSGSWGPLSMGVLLHEMERFSGICILIANNVQGSIVHRLEPDLLRRLRFLLEFRMPDPAVRARMWRRLLPDKVPLADDVDFETLGQRFQVSSGAISGATVRAAAKAALRGGEECRVHQKDLVEAIEAERERVRDEIGDIALRAFI